MNGSTVCPAAGGRDWRLHARCEPARGSFTDLQIARASTAEALRYIAVQHGDVVVEDRGYARVGNFVHAQHQGSAFITRIDWRSVTLFAADGTRLDPIAAVTEQGPAVVEHSVRIGDARTPAILILMREPAEAPAGSTGSRGTRQIAHPSGRRVHDAADLAAAPAEKVIGSLLSG